MDGHEITELNLLSLERTKRIDAEFYKKENIAVDSVLSSWNKRSIADCFHVSDGNHMSISESFCETGIPYYRGQDIYHLFIENASPLMIDHATFDKPQMRRSHLKKGDILMSIVGAIVGNSAMVTSQEPATCSCKLSIMRSKDNGITPELLLVYIKTRYGQVQIQKFKRGAAQTGLLLEDFDQLFIPVFGDKFQEKIKLLVDQTYECMQQAVNTYEDVQNYLNSEIGIDVDIPPGIATEETLSNSFKVSGRLDAEYYQLKYSTYADAIFSNPNGFTYIRDKFQPIKAKCNRTAEAYNYIEIGDISVSDGSASANLIVTEELPDNAKIMTKAGDLLVSTVRPNRGAVAILESDDYLVSGAFTVLRQSSDYPKEILQVLLRSDLYKDWLLRYNVGTSYPVIKDEDVLNMPIPIMSDGIQAAVIDKVRESTSLRNKSSELLDAAKQAVEMAIEQGEDAALAWLKDKVE